MAVVRLVAWGVSDVRPYILKRESKKPTLPKRSGARNTESVFPEDLQGGGNASKDE